MEKDEITESVEPYERPVITREQAESGDYPCLIDGNDTAVVWLMVEEQKDEEYDDSWLTVLSSFPWPYPDEKTAQENPKMVPEHLVDYEIDNMGVGYLLGIDKEGELEKFMEKEGIVAFQPFKVRLKVEYVRCGSYDCQDWDMWPYFEILEKRPPEG